VVVTPATFDERVVEDVGNGLTVVAANRDPSIPAGAVIGILSPPDLGLGSGIVGVTTGSTIQSLRVEASINVHDARVPFTAVSEIEGSLRVVSRRPFPSGTEVPIDIGLSGFTTANATAVRGQFPLLNIDVDGDVSFSVPRSDGPSFVFNLFEGTHCVLGDSFSCSSPNPNNIAIPSVTVHEFLDFDIPFEMEASALAFPHQFINADYDASAVAILDPTIAIDPSFPFPDDVQLVFSSNLFSAEAAPVPGPGTLILLGSGLAGLAGLVCAKLGSGSEKPH